MGPIFYIYLTRERFAPLPPVIYVTDHRRLLHLTHRSKVTIKGNCLKDLWNYLSNSVSFEG